MKLVDMTCPHCAGQLKINSAEKITVCEYCGAKLILDNETLHMQFDNAEESGYQFEKGRQRAQAEARQKQSVTPQQYNSSQNKKKNIWLWALGWIVIFPVPLTILMLRNKTLGNNVKYGIIIIAWVVYLIIGFVGKSDQSNNDSNNQSVNPSNTEMTIGVIKEENTTDTTEKSSENTMFFADDEVVNKFITEFNETSLYEITEISKGNIRTKYFGYSNNRYLEMINANDALAASFCLTINGDQEETGKQEMFDVFKEAVKVFDSTISDEELNNVIINIKGKDVLVENYSIGEHIIITYVPIKELSYGKTKCRIDMLVDNYK